MQADALHRRRLHGRECNFGCSKVCIVIKFNSCPDWSKFGVIYNAGNFTLETGSDCTL